MIIVVNFGSQTAHLILRRIRELGIDGVLLDPQDAIEMIKKKRPAGIIFSGGPASVYQKGAPRINQQIFDLQMPILGICYGLQLIAFMLGGEVNQEKKEYGPTRLRLVNQDTPITTGLKKEFRVWMSHGDEVMRIPSDFAVIGSTDKVKYAFVGSEKRKIYAVQFHPEVEHTQFGRQLLKNFVKNICGLRTKKRIIAINKTIETIKEKTGDARVIGAISGGVDSTVAAVLTAKAIGKRFYPFYIETGLGRIGTKEDVIKIFEQISGNSLQVINAEQQFLTALRGVIDPERKRKIIGNLYVKLFENVAKKIKQARFLLQGTIYSDVIESSGAKHSAKIKSHHNVGGLPEKLGLKLLEPLRFFYKDEVRKIGRKLGLPPAVVFKQPFPGPGNAIRIIGAVTRQRLLKQQLIDQILLEELEKAGWLSRVFQSFPILTGINSTAVKGDNRFYGEVVALRIYQSKDIMTASWAKLPYWLLEKIATRIVNEVNDVSRVVYDITTKPPATMEWE
jgi:GMP synthase (glutamine-hydrolysing)